ncbi:MAG: MBL fold metallo-hydrolase, partial [Fibrobacterota bacterium]
LSFPERSRGAREGGELHLQVLRSSSAGNCTALWNEKHGLLIDAGVTKSLLQDFLSETGMPVSAVLVTHGHSDHLSNAAFRLLHGRGVPFYFGSRGVIAYYRRILPSFTGEGPLLHSFEGRRFQVADFSIVPFEVTHDSEGGCFGFRLECGGARVVAFATDFVHVPDGLLPFFTGADAIVLESNHDPDLLERSGRPYHVKERIRKRAHLSNAKSTDFLSRILRQPGARPRHVFLAHISEECNNRKLTLETAQQALEGLSGPLPDLWLTWRDRPAVRVTV